MDILESFRSGAPNGHAVELSTGFYGEPVALPATLVRSEWDSDHLYLSFRCPWFKLHLKPHPVTDKKTDHLWDWDVAEAFIGTDYHNIARYKEFQVSPQGEFVDLDIDRDHPETQPGVAWVSGFTVAARIDPDQRIWTGEMKIPFRSLGIEKPEPGLTMRLGLFRIEGPEPNRTYIAWRPTGSETFHVPEAFGTLLLR